MTEDEYLESLERERYLAWVADQENGSDTSEEAYANHVVDLAESWIERESGRWGVRS